MHVTIAKFLGEMLTWNSRDGNKGWKEWKILVLALPLCDHQVSLYQHPLPPLSLTHFSLSFEGIGKLQDLTQLVSGET